MTQTLVFDLDGTLVESAPDIAAALNATLAEFDRQVPLEEVKRMVGGGIAALFEKASLYTALTLSPEDSREALARLKARYVAEPARRSTVRDWVGEVMTEHHEAGTRIAVCSNKDEEIVIAILDALDLSRRVHGVVGARPGSKGKPDAEPLLRAIAAAGGALRGALLVGDSGADVGAARAAGVPVVLVTGGYGDEDIATLGADAIVTDADELRAAIAALI